MGRVLTPEATTLIGHKVLARHLTLKIDWPQGVTTHWAGVKAMIGGVFYNNKLISSTSLEQTQGRPADRVEITSRNDNWEVTNLNRAGAEPGAWVRTINATVGRIMRDPHSSDTWIWVQIFQGEIVAVQTEVSQATFNIISDIYASPVVGAVAILGKICRFAYRDPDTCAYDGPLPDCSHLLEGENGCQAHLNTPHFGGSNQDTEASTLTTPPPDNGGGTGDPGGTDGGGNSDPGDGRGRIYDPAILEAY